MQARFFGMVERGMGETAMRGKGKLRCNSNINTEGLSTSGDDAMWAVVLTKELWKEGVWCVSSAPHPVVAIDQNYRNDAKSDHYRIGVLSPCHQGPDCTFALLPQQR